MSRSSRDGRTAERRRADLSRKLAMALAGRATAGPFGDEEGQESLSTLARILGRCWPAAFGAACRSGIEISCPNSWRVFCNRSRASVKILVG
jgi:hypothetical protein